MLVPKRNASQPIRPCGKSIRSLKPAKLSDPQLLITTGDFGNLKSN